MFMALLMKGNHENSLLYRTQNIRHNIIDSGVKEYISLCFVCKHGTQTVPANVECNCSKIGMHSVNKI